MEQVDISDPKVRAAVVCLASIGSMVLASKALSTARSVAKYFVWPRSNLAARYGEGSWALITGASNGLGKAYSFELAHAGFNIILMGRDRPKTEAVAMEIRTATGVKTKVLIYDLATLETEDSIKELEKLLKTNVAELDVSILANNAGVLHFGRLGDKDISDLQTMINVNVNAQTYISLLMLPQMLKREKRSAVINLSSKAAFYARGNMTMYCATKRYNLALSACMQDAYADKLDVMTVTPASVKTGMNPGTGSYTVQPDEHAKAVVDQLGWQSQTWGSHWHALQWWVDVTGPLAWVMGPIAQRKANENFKQRAIEDLQAKKEKAD